MKNKIRCLFDKIIKFIQSEHFIDDVLPLITVAVVIFSTFLCMLLSPISTSAYGQYPYNVTLTNTGNIPIDGSITINYWNNGDVEDDAFGAHTITQRLNDDLFIVSNNIVEDGIPYFTLTNGGESFVYLGDIPAGTYYVDYVFYSTDSTISIESSSVQYAGFYELDLGDLGTVGSFVSLSNSDNYVVEHVDVNIGDVQSYLVLRPIDDVPPAECPTLEEQIADYSGSWSSLVDIIQANNNTLYGEYISTLYSWRDDGANSVTLEQRLEEFEGDFDDLIEGLRISNPRLYEQYNSLIEDTLQQGRDFGYSLGYNEGYDVGESDGYKVGQQDGYNKGASDSLVQNFFGNFLQGVVQAVDSIHFYEVIDDNGTPDPKDDIVEFYISPWTILIVFIGLALVLIFLKVWRGG